MPRRKVAPTATVSKVPEDALFIAVSADAHVSSKETQEPVIQKRWTGASSAQAPVPVGQGAILKQCTREGLGEQTSAPEAVVEEHPSPVVWQPPSPPPAPPIPLTVK